MPTREQLENPVIQAILAEIEAMDTSEVPKCQTGDRVRCIEENKWVRIGATGTVLELSDAPYIEWDSIDDCLKANGIAENCVWSLNQDKFELI